MALSTQTMTDEQRKSVALEYLNAFDTGGVTSTGGSILDLFADDAILYFPKWGVARGRDAIGEVDRRRRGHAQVDRPSPVGVQLDLHRHGRPRVRRDQPRRAPRRAVAGRRPRLGGRPLVRRLRDPGLEDPALLHLPRSGLRRQGHAALPVARGERRTHGDVSGFTYDALPGRVVFGEGAVERGAGRAGPHRRAADPADRGSLRRRAGRQASRAARRARRRRDRRRSTRMCRSSAPRPRDSWRARSPRTSS